MFLIESNQAHGSMVIGSLIEVLRAWCMFVCYKLVVDIRRVDLAP